MYWNDFKPVTGFLMLGFLAWPTLSRLHLRYIPSLDYPIRFWFMTFIFIFCNFIVFSLTVVATIHRLLCSVCHNRLVSASLFTIDYIHCFCKHIASTNCIIKFLLTQQSITIDFINQANIWLSEPLFLVMAASTKIIEIFHTTYCTRLMATVRIISRQLTPQWTSPWQEEELKCNII